MAAAAQHAALKAKWMVALKSLKLLPAAAAARSLPPDTLDYMASQALVDCSCAAYNIRPDQTDLKGQLQLKPVFKLVVHKLKIPLHLCKAVAALLSIPYTFHMAIELLHPLKLLIGAVRFESDPGDPSTPGLTSAICTQVAASGMLQQLPDALKTAQKQLRSLKPTGSCGVPCKSCKDHLRSATRKGLSNTGSYSLQDAALRVCTELLAIWPGTRGALGSPEASPILLCVAKLALSSLQYVCRQAGELHTSSSSTPPPTLVDLGRAALDACAALTRAADTVSQGRMGSEGLEPVTGLPSSANQLLSSPKMLSVLVAAFNADVYGQYDEASITAASAPVVPDLSNPLALMYRQARVAPDDNLPTTAWRQMCAREQQLDPGQGLLPPLQAELLQTLGCNAKGFLWLAPIWKSRKDSHDPYSATLPSCLVVASSMTARLRSSSSSSSSSSAAAGSAASAAAMDVALRQFLLLPVLMLRRELNKQQASRGWDAGLLTTLRAGAACLPLLQLWNNLHNLVASTRASAAAGSSTTAEAYAEADGADEVSPQGLSQLTPVLHEMLQLLAHLLLGVMHTPQLGSSSSSGGASSSARGSSSKDSASSSGGGSTSRAGGQGSASSSAKHCKDVSPAAAATALSCVIAVLLPLATQAVLAQEASTTTCDMSTSSSTSPTATASGTGSRGSGSSSSSSAATASGTASCGCGCSSSSTAASASATASSNHSPDTSLASAWVPLLLRLTAALEQAMRFEAKHGPSQAELQATQHYDGFGNVAGYGPNGSAAWLATFLLLSPVAHAQYGCVYSKKEGNETPTEHQPALLQWMVDNTSPEQLPAVQQRLLTVLTTASKVSLSTKDSKQLAQANQAFSGMLRTAVQVLNRLLPQPVGYSSIQAAARKAAARKAAAAAAAAAASRRSTQGSGSAAATAKGRGSTRRSLTDTVTELLSVMEEGGFLDDRPELSSMLHEYRAESRFQAAIDAFAAASTAGSSSPSSGGAALHAAVARAAAGSSSRFSRSAAPAATKAGLAAGSSNENLAQALDHGPAAVKGQAQLAAGGAAGSSSSSSSSHGSGSAATAAAQGDDSAGSSSQASGQAAPAQGNEPQRNEPQHNELQHNELQHNELQLDTGSFDSEAVLAWLSLLGRCFVQASQQLTSRVQQHAAGSEVGSGPRLHGQGLRTQQQRMRDRAWVAKELRSLYGLSVTDLPRCIVRVAVLLSTTAGNPEQQQLPKQKHLERPAMPGKGPVWYENVDEALSVGCQELQQLRGAGQLLAGKCSSIGLNLAAVQQSTWALAKAAAAAAPVFHGADMYNMASAAGLEGLDPRGAVAFSDAQLLDALLGFGLTLQQAQEAVDSPYQGVRGCPEMTALAVLHSTPAQAYMQQLQAAGLALSSLPTAAACNNPNCSSVSGASEQGVSCKACSACHLAVYCKRSCQKQHWGVHKPVCQAVQAATSAAAASASTA